MKTTIYSLLFLIGTLFLFTQCEKEKDPVSDDLNNKKALVDGCTVIQDLWAGAGKNDVSKGTNVGSIMVTYTAPDILHATYNVNPPWELSEAHVWVGNDKYDIPKNAAPGQFDYALYEAPFEFDIKLSDHGINPADDVYLAVHGVVCTEDGMDPGELGELPVTVPYVFNSPPSASPIITTIEGESFLAGTYDGWCVQAGVAAYQDQPYTGWIFSSLDIVPDTVVNYPENLDLVNWIINQDFIGTPSGCGGVHDWGSVQIAIWKLIQDETISPDHCKANEIIEMAFANGEGFIPGCGDKFAIILYNETAQNTFIEYPVPCETSCETAWAFGEDTFIDLGISKNWGWIFEMVCN